MLLPLSMILLPESPPAGMDLGQIAIHQARARKTTEPVDFPVKVTVEGSYWRVCDGRHRVLGFHAGGRSHIDAEICRDHEH